MPGALERDRALVASWPQGVSVSTQEQGCVCANASMCTDIHLCAEDSSAWGARILPGIWALSVRTFMYGCVHIHTQHGTHVHSSPCLHSSVSAFRNAGVCVRNGVQVYNASSTWTEYTFAFIAGDLHVTIYTWLIGCVCVCDRQSVCVGHRFMWRQKRCLLIPSFLLMNHWEIHVWENCIFHA